jgi:hypothetical protein
MWSKEFVCDSINSPGSPPYTDRTWKVDDLDGDDRNEIIYAPVIGRQSPDANWLFCFSPDGNLAYRRYCGISGEYPGDTAGVLYDFEYLKIPRVAGRPIIITEVATSPPSRSHIRLWDVNGDSVGWYINAGGSKFAMAEDLDDDGREELLFHCYHNPLFGTSLLVLSADSACGCSPPYDRFKPNAQSIERGRQYAYIFMPTSAVGRVDIKSGYSQPLELRHLGDRQIAAYSTESNLDQAIAVIYVFNHDLRLERITFTDQFVARYAQLFDSAGVHKADLPLEVARLRDSVLYWNPQGWMKAPERF